MSLKRTSSYVSVDSPLNRADPLPEQAAVVPFAGHEIDAGNRSHSVSDSAYRPDIDGLRAIAVISVVLFHAGLPGVRAGFVGVDVFFVISGYLIGGIILRGAVAGRFRNDEFYARRARRILPALLCVIAFTLLAGALLLGTHDYRSVGATSLSALLAISNFSFCSTRVILKSTLLSLLC